MVYDDGYIGHRGGFPLHLYVFLSREVVDLQTIQAHKHKHCAHCWDKTARDWGTCGGEKVEIAYISISIIEGKALNPDFTTAS